MLWRTDQDKSANYIGPRTQHSLSAGFLWPRPCWQFRVEDKVITILPDQLRRCPAVDPVDLHVIVSLGCAADKMSHAALANGQHARPVFEPGQGALPVALSATPAQLSPLF